jgi:maltose alpha-D-glucosyltransferase/alpha-amylase
MISNDPHWYKDAVIYELHVRAFQDSTNDGIGDFQGLMRRLPWLAELGVNCLWLLPFYPSPLRDDGYDTANYRDVHPDYGTLRDFRAFLAEAHRLGIRVITELVLNHTSDQHPWFQDARRAPRGSSKRDWYVWSDDPEQYAGTRIIFTDTESSNWTWDPVARQYYWHRFFSHQPDLNFDHPPVRRAVERVLRFWLDMGIDGVRLDAVPYLVEREGTSCENLPETHAILRDLRAVADRYEPRRIFLAEANQWPEDVVQYFGQGDECHMAYHFPLMPRLFMALAQEDAHPVEEILARTPAIPDDCQWALFLRNHDELTLEMVTDAERDYMYSAYAADPRMRINVGIRRRLAPLLGNSRPKIELLNGLLLSLPGTPILYYGDEIGMGDNIYLGDRNGVRTPMHWSPDRNAGFSSAEFAKLYSPPVMDGSYAYQAVNVESQERDPSSLLRWMRRILSIRAGSRTFGRGSLRFLESSNRRVLAFLREWEGETLLVVANFSRHPQPVELRLRGMEGRVPVELFGGTSFPQVGEDDYQLSLGPHGFFWFRLDAPRTRNPTWREDGSAPARTSIPVIDVRDPSGWWRSDAVRLSLQERLPLWLLERPWFHERGESLDGCRIVEVAPIGPPTVLVRVLASGSRGSRDEYAAFLCCVEGEEADRIQRTSPDAILARLRGGHGSEDRLLVDALAARPGLPPVVAGFRDQPRGGSFRFASEEPHDWIENEPQAIALSGHHPFVASGNRILKVFHHLHEGEHPLESMLRHLQEREFPRAPRLLGTIRQGKEGRLLGALLERLPHQGSARERMLDLCTDHLEEGIAALGSSLAPAEHPLRPALELASLLGRRTGELHAALAHAGSDPRFGRERWTPTHRTRLVASLMGRSDALEPFASEPLRAALSELRTFLANLDRSSDGGFRIRCHGDLHLGQILWNENDFMFVDFEGFPGSPLAERFERRSPLRDLAAIRLSLEQVALDAATRGRMPPDASATASAWAARVWSSFLDGYRTTEAEELLPMGDAFATLLRLHLADRILPLRGGRPGSERLAILEFLPLVAPPA